MTTANISTPPAGITVNIDDKGDKTINHRTTGVLTIKVFAFLWCGIWLGLTIGAMIALRNEPEGRDGFIYVLIAFPILPFFLIVGITVAAYFLWLFLKRTQLTLGKDALIVARKFGPIRTETRYEKSMIASFTVVQDGGRRKDNFLSFAVRTVLNNQSSSALVSRQEREVAQWIGDTLNQWLTEQNTNLFGGFDKLDNN